MVTMEDGSKVYGPFITSSIANCCGAVSLSGMESLAYWPSERIKAMWAWLKTLNETTNRPFGVFSVGQFLFFGNENHQKETWMNLVPYTVIGTYQSASEPGHLTYIYNILFKDFK